jgi:hypothetical protein
VKKSQRMETFVEELQLGITVREEGFDPCYLGYFECFNSQRYYEAHDVLEHLWLKNGRTAPDYAFYKGLIQLAGGFVHLKLQYARPDHPTHGRRLHPAERLFLLASRNLAPYRPHHLGLDLDGPVSLGEKYAALIVKADFLHNPWSPETAPLLYLSEVVD